MQTTEYQQRFLKQVSDTIRHHFNGIGHNAEKKKTVLNKIVENVEDLRLSETYGSGTNANYKILKRYLPPNERQSRPALKILLTRQRSTKIYYIYFNKPPKDEATNK
jgi:hypothetical protein